MRLQEAFPLYRRYWVLTGNGHCSEVSEARAFIDVLLVT